MNAAPPTCVDVAIAGGGMVGASLALALADTDKRVMLIEAVAPGGTDQPSFDDRTSALGNGSRRILETLGVWRHLAGHAGAVREIRVSDARHIGAARISAAEQGLEALGYVVPNRSIGAALWRQLGHCPQIIVRCPARVSAVHLGPDGARLTLAADGAGAESIEARVVVAADGALSMVRAAAGIGAAVEDYRQVAVVVHLATDLPSSDVAYERFTTTGPLAVLPLPDGRYTVVWTLAPERAQQVLALDEGGFCSELQRCFGWRIGRILRAGLRSSYPLRLSRAEGMVGARAVLVGNAAQALHPVAGQGFNLGIRDCACLVDCLARSPLGQPGGAVAGPDPLQALHRYAARRRLDRTLLPALTSALPRVFSSTLGPVVLARSAALLGMDLLPALRRPFTRLLMYGAPR